MIECPKCKHKQVPRDFASAPKDGTQILAFSVDYCMWTTTCWLKEEHVARWDSENISPEFSHWLPALPEPT